MPDYKEMYLKLFRASSDALEKADEIKTMLENATAETEEMYISAEEPQITMIPKLPNGE